MKITQIPRLTLITEIEAKSHLRFLYDIRRDEVDKHGDFAKSSESPYITNPVNYLRTLVKQYVNREVILGVEEPKWDIYKARASYLSTLELLKKEFNLKPEVVYAPGHGNDVSHIAAFHDSKEIISLEINPDQVNILRSLFADEENVKCFLGSAEKFILENKADLLLLIAAGYNQKFPLSQVKVGGYVYCNNQSLERDCYREELKFVAKIFSDGYISFDRNEEELEVKSDEELKLVKDSRHLTEGRYLLGELKNLASYADVLKVVYFATGDVTNIVQKYKEIRENEIEKQVQTRISETRERRSSPERSAQVDELCRQNVNWKRSDFEWSEEDYSNLINNLKKQYKKSAIDIEINGKAFKLKPLPKKHHEEGYLYKKT